MNVAFIPIVGENEEVILRSIKEINGHPFVYWTILEACKCDYIDRVYVATDNDAVRRTIESFCRIQSQLFVKAKVTDVVSVSSTGCSEEEALLEFAKYNDFDKVVLIKALSPLLESADLNKGFEAYRKGADSVFSVIKFDMPAWSMNEGKNVPVNADEIYVENGAFYITTESALKESKSKISGNVKTVLMSFETAYNLEDDSAWNVVEAIMRKRDSVKRLNDMMDSNKLTITQLNSDSGEVKECKYKMFLTDCDGCLTDGGMYYSEKGDELKKFNTKDGMGFGILREAGIITGVITGEDVELNRRRCEKLKLDILAPGCADKVACIKGLCEKYNIDLSEVVYIGDDINDRRVIEMVGFGCCPNNAHEKVKRVADYVAVAKGGEGVIREVVDKIME